jgi:hypothetical protein
VETAGCRSPDASCPCRSELQSRGAEHPGVLGSRRTARHGETVERTEGGAAKWVRIIAALLLVLSFANAIYIENQWPDPVNWSTANESRSSVGTGGSVSGRGLVAAAVMAADVDMADAGALGPAAAASSAAWMTH